jgi:hypothetical protein
MNINLPATVFWGSPGVQGFDTSPHDDSRINDDQIRDFGGDPFQSTNEKRGVTSPRWTFQEQQTIDQVTHFFGP